MGPHGRRDKHLKEFFGEARAVEITPDRVTAYIAFRQQEAVANATINRELAALKRMFRLAEKAGKVDRRPYIPMLAEDNIRTDFFEHDQFQAVVHQLPDDLQPVFEVTYITGWRVRSEILTRQWHHIDFDAGWLRLEPGETKNRDGRMFPLTPELREILERQRAHTEAIQRETGRIVPWVFHRTGEPIKCFHRSWLTACLKAGFATEAIYRPLCDRRREHVARGRGQAERPPRRPARGAPERLLRGAAREFDQSNVKVSGLRQPLAETARPATHRKTEKGNGGQGRD